MSAADFTWRSECDGNEYCHHLEPHEHGFACDKTCPCRTARARWDSAVDRPINHHDLVQMGSRIRIPRRCLIPPDGWRCTRGAGHDGPCAAVQVRR